MSQDSSASPTPTAPIQGIETPQAPEVQKTEKQKDDFLAPKFAALTRKEKEIRAKEAAIKAQQAEIEKMRSEWESKSKSTQAQEVQLLAELKQNPLRFMEKHGLTFDQLTEMQLNNQNPTTEMMLKQVEEKLRAEMEEKYGKLTETLAEKEKREAQEQYDRAVNWYKSELSEFVKTNADTYELIVANDATDLMFETAEEFYKQTGSAPSHEELAKAVESHLEEQAKKIFELKKFKSAKPEPPKAETSAKTAQTLSNTLAAEVPKSSHSQLSVEQSKKEAAKLIRWIE